MNKYKINLQLIAFLIIIIVSIWLSIMVDQSIHDAGGPAKMIGGFIKDVREASQ